ncbi:MAG: tRNA lysidine(34) synthetase TilS [Corynebacterium sp.]|nr:tRNA lysidine(34) synthetase TilS [Corynebacterium sp.]
MTGPTQFPFWPRKSPNFAKLRHAVRPIVRQWEQDYPESPIHVGLSGGADSLALTAALIAEASPGRIHALCVDHQLQAGSATVAMAAAKTAKELGAAAAVIPVHVAPGNLEAEARRARYAAMREYTPRILIAHTADDAVETLLMHLMRGRIQGLHPISMVENLEIYRPLLGLRRAHTTGACEELGLHAWQDPHNFSDSFRRPRIRHELIPLLNEIAGGDASAALMAAGTQAVAMDSYIKECACTLLQEALIVGPEPRVSSTKPGGEGRSGLGVDKLEQKPEPIRLEVIAQWLAAEGMGVSTAVLRRIDALIHDWHGQGDVAIPARAHGENRPGSHKRTVVGRIDGVLAIREEKDEGNEPRATDRNP